ncbi:MAG: 50S ribosomal protein L19e [Candidatus Woesearchaeota archaeon]
MNLKSKKRIAAKVLECSPKRVIFNQERLDEIKEALTREDIRALIKDRAIIKKPKKSISRFRIKKAKKQKSKGRRKGYGSRKGKKTARLPKKEAWMNKVRMQRALLKRLKEKNMISRKAFRDLYLKVKGGFFRSKSHLLMYIKDNKLFLKDLKPKEAKPVVNEIKNNQ